MQAHIFLLLVVFYSALFSYILLLSKFLVAGPALLLGSSQPGLLRNGGERATSQSKRCLLTEPSLGPVKYITKNIRNLIHSGPDVYVHTIVVILLSTCLFLQLKNIGNFDTTLQYRLPVYYILCTPHEPQHPCFEGGICHFCTCIRVFLISICSNSERQLPLGRSLFHLFAAIAPVQLWSLG